MKRIAAIVAAALALLLSGCMVGPKYHRPAVATPPAFKEAPAKAVDGWVPAHPAAAALKGDWWTMFGDPQLNVLEAKVDGANQTLKESAANFRAARAQIGYSRSFEAPTISTAPSAATVRNSPNQPNFNTAAANNGSGEFTLPVDLNYEVDLWGRIRRGVAASEEQAQAAAADLASVRLSLHAELALDYFDLRGTDAQIALLKATVAAYRQALQLTEDRYRGGVAPEADVSAARTQLEQTQVELTDLGVKRAEDEHAIAVLIGRPPATLTIPASPLNATSPAMPQVPGTLPAQLLERRPDIAAAERRMAVANEQIGIAQAAFYPTLSLSGVAGFEGTSMLNWLEWPSRFWAVGPEFSELLFDAGRRRATKRITEAGYDATVANYRQTALTAFQQVEDNLAALRVLSTEATQQQRATASARQSLTLYEERYAGGVDTYLQVVVWQTAALADERNDLSIRERRLAASVLLIKALGGGWNTSHLPRF